MHAALLDEAMLCMQPCYACSHLCMQLCCACSHAVHAAILHSAMLCMQALLPGYKAAMEAYMAAVHGLSNRLLLLIAIELQLSSDFFLHFYDKPMMYLRPLHSSPHVSLPEEVTTRLPHTAMHMQMSYSIYIQQTLVQPPTYNSTVVQPFWHSTISYPVAGACQQSCNHRHKPAVS